MRTLEIISFELEQQNSIVDVAAANLAKQQDKQKSLRAEMIAAIEAQNLTKVTVGKFTVSIRRNKVWAYSKWVSTLEKMLKSRKEKEQQTGIATFTENRTWQFLNITK